MRLEIIIYNCHRARADGWGRDTEAKSIIYEESLYILFTLIPESAVLQNPQVHYDFMNVLLSPLLWFWWHCTGNWPHESLTLQYVHHALVLFCWQHIHSILIYRSVLSLSIHTQASEKLMLLFWLPHRKKYLRILSA